MSKKKKVQEKKGFKTLLIKFVLYIYLHYIKSEDLEVLKKWAIPFIKPVWFIHSAFMWLCSVLFFPVFAIGMKIEESMPEIKNIYNNNNIYEVLNRIRKSN